MDESVYHARGRNCSKNSRRIWCPCNITNRTAQIKGKNWFPEIEEVKYQFMLKEKVYEITN